MRFDLGGRRDRWCLKKVMDVHSKTMKTTVFFLHKNTIGDGNTRSQDWWMLWSPPRHSLNNRVKQPLWNHSNTPPKFNIAPKQWWFGRLLSFWDGIFSGAMAMLSFKWVDRLLARYLPYFYTRIFEYTETPIVFNFFGDLYAQPCGGCREDFFVPVLFPQNVSKCCICQAKMYCTCFCQTSMNMSHLQMQSCFQLTDPMPSDPCQFLLINEGTYFAWKKITHQEFLKIRDLIWSS